MTTAGAAAWTLEVARDDHGRTRLQEHEVPEPAPGEAVLRVDRVGLTTNNVTYAVLGDSFRYWEFFPAADGWGVVPVWGFADVVASQADGVSAGDRFYGYLPMGSHLVVRPERVDARGFRDGSPHRARLPSPYNAYARTTGDAAYSPDGEDLQVLYRPLCFTSWLLADWLVDNDLLGAQAVVMSSASSKTAYGAAFDLSRQGRRVIGLTSAGNADFVRALGCYDDVVRYDELEALPADVPVAYVDLAGDQGLATALRERLGDRLVHEVVVGITSGHGRAAGTLAGTGGHAFFAPDQMRKRGADWGRQGLDDRFAEAWRAFAPVVEGWVDVVVGAGPEALDEVWRELQSGRVDPRAGHVLQL